MKLGNLNKWVVISMLLLVGTTSVVSSQFAVIGSYQKDIQEKTFDMEMTFEFTVPSLNFQFGSTQINGTSFATVEIPGEGFTIAEGEAKLPVLRYMVQIPEKTMPTVEVTSVSWESTSLNALQLPSKIQPVQPSVVKTETEAPFVINDSYYASSDYMQTNVACITDIGCIRGHRFAILEVSPLQYKPSSGELKMMTSCDITISFPGADMEKTMEIIERYTSPAYEKLLQTLFINYDVYHDTLGPLETDEGYLIIVYDAYYDEILPLASWKETRGFNVTVTMTSQIPGGPTKDNIHNYIDDAYHNWSTPPSYVLLVGDTSEIPTYQGTTGWPGPADAVDLYYVTVNGSDYFPDIFIGRFPPGDEADVTAMVNKTIYYEQGVFPTTNWIKKAAFMAGNDNYWITEGTHNYVIDTYLNPHNYSCDKLYEVSYGATTQDVKNALNDGRSIAVYSGHGSTTSWADGPPLYQSDIRSLTNQGMYPFICSHACDTGTFSISECFGETWVREADKAGLAFWGASSSTLWDEDDILEKRMFRAWWNDSLGTIGGMTDKALYYLYQYYSGGGYTKYYFEAYNVLGDPSVNLWTEEPGANEPPEITNVQATPVFQDAGGWVNITCNISDDSGINVVKAVVTYPDGTTVETPMTEFLGNSTYGAYYYNTTYAVVGMYSYYIWANDTDGNWNVSDTYTFYIGSLMNITCLTPTWNFIALPFNQSIEKQDVFVFYAGVTYSWADAVGLGVISDCIFGWDRATQTYIFADTLKPGYGYWVFSYENCTLTAYPNQTVFTGYITNVKPGWNTIGVPHNQTINKTDIIISYNGTDYTWADAVTLGIINNYIFGWDRIAHSYEFSDILQPGYSYWFYSYEPCVLKQ